MFRPQYLLHALLALFTSRGVSVEAMEPWRAWKGFKEFARAVDEIPDPGVSVQSALGAAPGTLHLSFVRQVLSPGEEWMEPVGGVVCELTFDVAPGGASKEWELWSFDYRSFERFVDIVERDPSFAELLVTRARSSRVYWVRATPTESSG